MSDDAMIDKIFERMDKQDSKLDKLADAVYELAQAITKKEANDHRIDENVNRLEDSVKDLNKRVRQLETIAAGDKTFNDIRKLVIRSVIGFLVVTAGGGIVWAVAQSVQAGGG